MKTPVFNFLLMMLFLSLLIGGGGYFYAQSVIRYNLQQRRAQQREAVRLAAQTLQEQLRHAVGDIEFLKTLPGLTGVLASPTRANLHRLSIDFTAYLVTHRNVDQVRWIDEAGRERVRINAGGRKPEVVPSNQLQNKSGRPYVFITKGLPKNAIYVSPLDLNIEHHRIEVPYKPVIRFAMPVFGLDGRPHGLVVVNFLGQRWIDAFVKTIASLNAYPMLVNRNGYWLYSRNPANDWGFMLGAKTLFQRSYHTAWKDIEANPQGSALLPDGLWTWDTVDPLKAVGSEARAVRQTSGTRQVDGRYGYVWHVILRESPQEIAVISGEVWHAFAPLLGFLFVVGTLISAWIARSQYVIEHLNRDLAKRAKIAEAASNTKADFMANMSHEIRTPMNAVLGLAYLLEKRELPEEAQDLVRKIRIAGRSLQGIIDDILDFSKIEAGRIKIEHEPFLLSDVLDNLSTIMAANAGDKDIELIIAPSPNFVNTLVGDALRLEQILINLTGNAIKFTQHGFVEVRIERLEAPERAVKLRFSVHDTGIGIPPEKQATIFEQFAQADTSTTRRFGGSGLGLTICRHMVEMMSGKIGVISDPGQGSEFWFTLTFELGDDTALPFPEMRGLNLLIVDDNPVAREALRGIATGLGWACALAGSGREAIEYVSGRQDRSQSSEVILLDWKMPEMDGIDVMRAIRGANSDAQGPVIIMVSAYLREELLALSGSDLADDVLSKPVTPSSLYNAVARALQVRHGGTSMPTQHGRRLAGLRLLVVDDSEINREVAQRIFAGEGAQVELADNGHQAVQWIEAHPGAIDIVLMDVQMPVMDGYEATRRIHQMPELADLPIVALTAGAFNAQRDAAKEAGMADFIAKPFDVETAIAILQQLTDRKIVSFEASVASAPELPATSDAVENYSPGLAVGKGLKIWKDAAVYRQYLRKFVRDYSGCVEGMTQAERSEAAALAHKLKGAAGNLALEEVSAAADELNRTLQAGKDPSGALSRLGLAMDAALAAIDRYAPEASADQTGTAGTLDIGKVGPLLARAFEAFDSDSPEVIEPVLTELAAQLPSDRFAPLLAAVENFDFSGGKAATRALAEELGVALEG